ncbi:hypothetical protein DFS34DRAFT_591022 [Phlyctochytrium arcticum]|nr:hypothetical protein DFS34DRAFT_591388 [Phlyctochytrium arcticum]KAI9103493.1 hypothetical protein DFS34DRAFT_591022 [Phlyctochytrium arcticum]
MIQYRDIQAILEKLPSNVLLTQYGNEHGIDSFKVDKTISYSCDKSDTYKNAILFNPCDIKEAMNIIPQIFEKTHSKVKLANSRNIYIDIIKKPISLGDWIIALIALDYKVYFKNNWVVPECYLRTRTVHGKRVHMIKKHSEKIYSQKLYETKVMRFDRNG